jgi:hypothetical protein
MLVNPKYQDIKEKLDEASVAYDLVSSLGVSIQRRLILIFCIG